MKELSRSQALELSSPYPYVLAVTLDQDDQPNVIGLGWWTFTSGNPMMIAISIGHTRYSHECLDYCQEFVLCFPAEDQKEGAWLCGTISGRDIDKFKEAGFTAVPSKTVKPPLIRGVTTAYECTVVDAVDTGDHTLYIGEVVEIHGTPDKPKHLYSIHYRKLVSLDYQGNVNFNL